MTDHELINQLDADEKATFGRLADLAGEIHPDASFVAKTGSQLRQRFTENRQRPARTFSTLWGYFAGTAAVAALVFGLIWLVRGVAPDPRQPSAPGGTPFVCPVTSGNGSQPPGETLQSQTYLGNGQLWTDLWPDGKIIMHTYNRESDGSYSMKWAYWRGVSGPLVIRGNRLDAVAEPLRANITSGYGDSGLIVFSLIFPTPGCWEVTGSVGDAALSFVTEVVLAEDESAPATPTSEPPSPTPTTAAAAQEPAYEARGYHIRMAAAFPETPQNVGVYTRSNEVAASAEVAQVLAKRFNLEGQVYQPAPDVYGTGSLLVTDGSRRLYVTSAQRFTYTTSENQSAGAAQVPLETAAPGIAAFLTEHGYDFEYRLQVANGLGANWFYVIPYYLENRPIYFEYGIPQGFRVQVDGTGQVITLEAVLPNLDAQAGTFGLISAEVAWQRYLDPATSLGVLDSFRSAPVSTPRMWARTYPSGQALTIFGHVSALPALEPSQPPLLSLDGTPLSGNITGMQNAGKDQLIKADGQFVETSGGKVFQVDTWLILSQYSPSFLPDVLQGSLRSNGQQVIFNSNGTDYVLENAPADLPLPLADVNVEGYLMEPEFAWKTISWFGDQSRGGGGGGGGGGSFAKLNLSGPVVPWPTPEPVPTQSAAGQRFEGSQGLLSVSVYQAADGTKSMLYGIWLDGAYYLLQGDAEFLSHLDAYQNRPVRIWGGVSGYSDTQAPIIQLERYDFPYPDLKFQLLTGTQTLETIDGSPVAVFIGADGTRYAQLSASGSPTNALIGVQGDSVVIEALIIPGESLGGLPAMRIFSGGMATSPKNGQPLEYHITADQLGEVSAPGPVMPQQQVLTIETIELVYFTNDPRYAGAYPQAMSPYVQPVWRFYGHNSSGDEVEILIQALRQEYLLPEAAPGVQGG